MCAQALFRIVRRGPAARARGRLTRRGCSEHWSIGIGAVMNTGVPAGSEQPVAALHNSAVEPTVLRMLLGTRLRRLRETAGITPEQAAHEIRASRSKISRMESGRGKFKDRDLADL